MGGLLGCYASATVDANMNKDEQILIFEKGKAFRRYIWGDDGIANKLEKIDSELYGNDIKLILFEFYINPLDSQMKYIEKGISYRKREKSIGIPLIINDENYFNKDENERYFFLKNMIFIQIDCLRNYVEKKKLDTKIDLILNDLRNIL